MRVRRSPSAASDGPRDSPQGQRAEDFESLLKRCEQRLRELPLPNPFNVEALSRVIGAHRGRPVKLLALPHLQPVMGVCIPGPAEDIVVYARETARLHREHIILHELCHLWCGHIPIPLTPAGLGDLLKPDINATMFRHLWRRAGYARAEDREAEVLASLVVQHVVMRNWPSEEAVTSDESAALQRIAAIMGQQDGRSP